MLLAKKIYQYLIKPHYLDIEETRKESCINIILLGLIILSGALALVYFLENPHATGLVFPVLLLVSFSSLILYLFSRAGYVRSIINITVGLLVLTNFLVIYWYTADSLYSLLSLGLTILITALLKDSYFNTIQSLIVIIFYVGIGLYQTEAILIQYTLILAIFALTTILCSREIERSFTRSYFLKTELKNERDALAQKMKSFTHSEDSSAQDKIAQLYRFAEFGRLSSGLFHDLMNPLTSVHLTINKLSSLSNRNLPIVKEDLDKVITTTNQIGEMITTIKKQIQTQEVESTFSLVHEIHEVTKLLQYKAQKTNVTIIVEAPEDIITYGNSVKFHQIMTNLISNAIDSYVTVETETKRDVLVSAIQNKIVATIKVTDTGCGIPASIVPKIFNPFFTTKPLFKGIGLGLSTTKEIIEKHFKGTIKVASQLHKGSAFTIQIPIHLSPQAAPDAMNTYTDYLVLE